MPTILEASRLALQLPPWRPVRQRFAHHGLADVEGAVRAQLGRAEIRDRLHPGLRVALGVGSRGIRHLQTIVRATVSSLREQGAEVFIVPAMGSHGGACAEGQVALLASLGITEAGVGAPIRASMETVELGEAADGMRVFFDRCACEADAVVPVVRVKPHTDFRGELESGLHKMIAIGLGKHRGASFLHGYGFARFGELVPAVGAFVLEKVNIPFGLALVEDSYEDTAIVEAVPREQFLERERALLRQARAWLPRLPFQHADVLVVQEMGKNISGAGIDPNVTGRYSLPPSLMPREVDVARLVVLDLTDESHGNAAAVGFADVTVQRLASKVDWHTTYVNQVTSGVLEGAKRPLVADTDREAIAIAVRTIPGADPAGLRMAWIKNTLELGELWLSEPLWASMRDGPGLEALGPPQPVAFDADGALRVAAAAHDAPPLSVQRGEGLAANNVARL